MCEGGSAMSLMEIFYGTKLVESALNKVKGRSKVSDQNIESGKKSKDKETSINHEEIDEIFDYIETESREYVIDQQEYLSKLCQGLKRPYFQNSTKSFRNMIFVFGPDGSGRKYAIRVIAKLLAIKKLTKDSSIYRLDFSQYNTSEKVDKLLLPDLYKAFYGKSAIVLIDNFDQAAPQALSYIANLGINGSIKTDKRFTWKGGTLVESTGSFEIGSSDRIGANDKYIVFVSRKGTDYLEEAFPKQFVDSITDVACTKKLSEEALSTITESFLEDCNEELKKSSDITIEYSNFTSGLLSEMIIKRGTHDVFEIIQQKVHDKIVQHYLGGDYSRGEIVKLKISDSNITGNGIILGKLNTGVDEKLIAELDEELNSIIGLQNVKDFIKKLREYVEFRQGINTNDSDISLHMIFTGNPGTGKTTVARIVSKYLKALGYLSSGHLVEVSRSDLVAQYLGQTANKTLSVINTARGGVLFIDEAYSLVRNSEDFFGVEAVDTLVKYMEDLRGDLVVILAGYTKELNEFLEINSGLKSRFNYVVDFPNYTEEEMLEIAETVALHNKYSIAPSSYQPLKRYYSNMLMSNPKDFGNGRLARNSVEKAIMNHSSRLSNITKTTDHTNIYELVPEDFNLEQEDLKAILGEAETELNNIIGLSEVKEFLRKLKKYVEINQSSEYPARLSYNMIFTGNPGTGKTTVARIVAKYMKGLGVLTGGQVIEVSRSELVSGYVGQTAKKTSDLIDNAIGGVLFVDEAYSLVQGSEDSFGMEAVNTLVKRIEDIGNNIIVILAGYTKEMTEFLNTNSGLKSRFNYLIEFPDYTGEEMVQIAQSVAQSKKYRVSEEAADQLCQFFTQKQASNRNDLGNGRLVRNVVEKAIFNHSQIVSERGGNDISAEERYTLLKSDFNLERKVPTTFDLEKELNVVVGMDEVKNHIRSLYSLLMFEKARAEMGLPSPNQQSLHMVFTGNPGTGKTTIARIVAKILYEMKILPNNKLVETDRASLVAGYVGQTAAKTLSVLEQARGGVLFIDEAYSLASSDSNDFGREAIDTIVKFMEDNRDDIVVILAGYTKEMKDFFNMNSGLVSRFPTVIEFADYTSIELLDIIKGMFKSNHFVLSPDTDVCLLNIFEKARSEENFGNGRFARNLYEKSIRNLSVRVTKSGVFNQETLTTVLPEDILLSC